MTPSSADDGGAFETQYEPGDINTLADVNSAGDVNTADDSNDLGQGVGGSSAVPIAVLEYLARSLANHSDEVVVDAEDSRGSLRLSLHVAQEDMGRVIGRRGRTAQAIRTLVSVAGAKEGIQTNVDIVDIVDD